MIIALVAIAMSASADTYDIIVNAVEGKMTIAEYGTVGINAAKTVSTDNAIYSISGQCLAAPQRGINIVSGKKVIY